MTDPVQSAIEEAQKAAANVAAPEGSLPAQTNAGVPAPASAPAAPLSNNVADFGADGMQVDGFIKVTEFGLLVPKECKKPVDSAKVRIDLSECTRHMVIKASRQKIVKYFRTYDGVMATDGRPWAQAIAEAKQLQENAEPYESVDIPMTLLEDAGDAEAGDELGYSLSTTNKKAFTRFLRTCAKAGIDLNTSVVEVKIGVEQKANDSYSWGIMTFELLGEANPQ